MLQKSLTSTIVSTIKLEKIRLKRTAIITPKQSHEMIQSNYTFIEYFGQFSKTSVSKKEKLTHKEFVHLKLKNAYSKLTIKYVVLISFIKDFMQMPFSLGSQTKVWLKWILLLIK